MGDTVDEEDVELEDDDRINFKVYDMPVELVQEYCAMAKLHYDNEVWQVLADAMALMKEKQHRRDLEERVRELEAKVAMLQAQDNYGDEPNNDGNDIPPTLGDAGGDDTTDAISGLESLNNT